MHGHGPLAPTESTRCMRPISLPRESQLKPVPEPSVTLPPDRAASRPPRRLVRCAPEIVDELPEPCLIRIDVNGCLAGTVLALPDAPRELAAGWSFMHGFYGLTDHLDRVTLHGNRVSVMVESGQDIDVRRLEAVGWAPPRPLPDHPVGEHFRIDEPALTKLIEATWDASRRDGAADGYVHAAVASAESVHCIARDLTSGLAAAKVLGWTMLDASERDVSVLLIRGVVERRLIEAAARVGISVVVTSGVPAADAFRAATKLALTIVGMAMSRTPALLVDGGHIDQLPPAEDPEEGQAGKQT